MGGTYYTAFNGGGWSPLSWSSLMGGYWFYNNGLVATTVSATVPTIFQSKIVGGGAAYGSCTGLVN